MRRPTVVIGAGPAGLTAGYMLAKAGEPVLVVEAEQQVGGLAKTVVRDGYRFDLGGHRFFTKSHEVQALWEEVLGEEFLLRPRVSRIYWNGRLLDYPLRAGNVVRKLGPLELCRSSLSYAGASLRRNGEEETFEQWVSNRFGKRLFELFFRSYTEKVWGVPTSEIRAEWAAQRIKNLSFRSAARSALFGARDNGVSSLIEQFHYPRYGPGQMWEAMVERIRALGGEVRLGWPAERLIVDGSRVVAVQSGGERVQPAHVISSLPLRTAVAITSPEVPVAVSAAARGLRYRDFLTVALVIEGRDLFPDNWIYVHEPAVRVGRIQNYRSWSPWMVPDPANASVGLEYFCFEGDELWSRSDGDLLALATREIAQLRLADPARVRGGYVARVPKAYPIYDSDYAQRILTIRGWLETVDNLQQIGRNGLHRYNNSDHSSLTAMRAVENLLSGASHDIWAVNAESVYHEQSVRDEHPYAAVPPAPETAERPVSTFA
jgi:protoporphyrinogen oxidase